MSNQLVAPKVNPIQQVELVHPVSRTLSNGVPVNEFGGLEQEIVRIDFIFNVGSAAGDVPLLTSMMLAMLTEGTKRLDAKSLNESLDFYGSYVQTDIQRDYCTLSLYGLTEHLGHTLPLIDEMLFDSVFPEDELGTQLTNGKQKLLVSLEKVGTLSQRLLIKSLYSSHQYGRLAEEVDFDVFKRESLMEFASVVLVPANLTIVASGNIPHNLLDLLDHTIGKRNSGDSYHFIVDKPSVVDGGTFFVEKSDSVQSGIAMGLSGFDRSQSDFADIQFLNCVLGGYFGSRLMSNIREDKGYTYGIGSGLRVMRHDCYWAVSTEVGSEYVEATLREIRFEFDRLRNELITVNELELVRNYLTGSFVRNSDGPFSMADRYISLWSSSFGYDYYTNYLNRLSLLTPKDVQEAAIHYLDFNRFVVCVSGSK